VTDANLVFLETPRLVLRRFTPGDVDLLIELDSDPDVMRFINGGRATPREEIVNDVLPAFTGYYERFEGYGFWAAVEKATGAFIGWFHLRPEPGGTSGDPELGYRLRSSAWGNGYATEGSRALIDKAFAELGAQRVVASTMAVNARSRRVMEKSGLTRVRAFHPDWLLEIDGGEEGGLEYAVEKAEWEAASHGRRNAMDWKLELVVVPVSDVDRAKAFYLEKAGFGLDVDHRAGDDFRVVQMTPPGSSCSITLMRNVGAAGSVNGLHLVVSDIDAARAELAERGTNVSEVYHFDVGGQVPGPDPERRNYNSFLSFDDPDGNSWLVQEVRRPQSS